ncbi:MAG TPA: TldD/PmbA family protein, partial [bacterium]|nr:TldD/PmbA family protein [bacterium]
LLSESPKAPLGNFPVVIHSSAGGTLIHEAIGHSLEADAVQRGISPVYHGRKGEKVATSSITILDDPTLSGKRGSYLLDGEGNPAERVVLIEEGVLKDYLYDFSTAIKDRRISNGHGRRESYQVPPVPRMGITYLAPGKEDPRQIIEALSRGILVKKMGGGQVNTANGDFVFEITEGYWVERGKMQYPIQGATLIGNGPRLLNEIERIGNDLGFEAGTCGKEGQGVPVSDAMPTIFIPRLTVGGQGKE